MNRLIPLLLLLLLAVLPAAAVTEKCVRAAATGTGSGNDWANALTAVPTTPARDTIYYIAKGTYATGISVNGVSGTSRIYFQRATAASHGTDTGWDDSYDDTVPNISGRVYINASANVTVDGLYIPAGHGQTGVLVDAFSGTASPGIQILNSEIAGPATSSPYFYTSGTKGISVRSTGSGTANDMVIRGNLVHGFETLIQTRTTSSLVIENNDLYNSNTSNGDPQSPHPNVAYLERCNNVTFRNNRVYNFQITGFYPNASGNSATVMTGFYVTGNIFFRGASPGSPGAIYPVVGQFYEFYVENNTFAGLGSSGFVFRTEQSTIHSGSFRNNIIYGTNGTVFAGTITHDYNWFTGASAFGEANGIAGGSTNPFNDSDAADFSLTSAIAGLDLGVEADYADMFGNPRTTWNRGAIEEAAVGGGDTTPPTLLNATIPAAGTTMVLGWSEAVTVGAGGSGGWSFTLSGSGTPLTATLSSGSGTSTLVYSLSRTPSGGETLTAGLDYTQPGNGLEDAAGNDAASINDFTLVNNADSGQTGVPVMTPAGGAAYATESVTLSSATAGALVYYTTDGSTPDTGDTLYTGAITLSATTVLKAVAVKAGLDDSDVAIETYQIGTWTALEVASPDFTTFDVPQQSGAFYWNFTVSVTSATADLIVGLSPNGPVDEFDDMGPIISFATDGTIKARDGAGYAADATIPYATSTTYVLTVAGDISTRTYSVAVDGETLATGFDFRSSQAAATELDNVGIIVFSGSATVGSMDFFPPGTTAGGHHRTRTLRVKGGMRTR
jgi:hypothetical protein